MDLDVHAFNACSISRLDKHKTGAAEPSLAELSDMNILLVLTLF